MSDDSGERRRETVLHLVLIGIALVPVLLALAGLEPWGVEPALGLFLALVTTAALVGFLRRN